MVQTFTDIQELYEDMLKSCKNFTLGITENTHWGDTVVLGETIYSNYEFQNCNFENGNNQLDFWQSTGNDGANLTLHNITGGKRVGDPATDEMFEYSFNLKNRKEPFVMLAFGWSKGGDI